MFRCPRTFAQSCCKLGRNASPSKQQGQKKLLNFWFSSNTYQYIFHIQANIFFPQVWEAGEDYHTVSNFRFSLAFTLIILHFFLLLVAYKLIWKTCRILAIILVKILWHRGRALFTLNPRCSTVIQLCCWKHAVKMFFFKNDSSLCTGRNATDSVFGVIICGLMQIKMQQTWDKRKNNLKSDKIQSCTLTFSITYTLVTNMIVSTARVEVVTFQNFGQRL